MSKFFDWFETDDAESEQKLEPEPCTAEAKYSQPFESSPAEQLVVVYAGFVHGQPGYIVRQRGHKPVLEMATPENQAREHPRGFFSSLARLAFGGKP
jgi:hypothetical protein